MTSYHLREIDARLRGACQIWPVSPCVPVFVPDETFGRTVVFTRHPNGVDLIATGETDNEYTVTVDGKCGCKGGVHGACYHRTAVLSVEDHGEGLYRLLMAEEATAAGIRLQTQREQSRQREAERV